MTQIKFDIRNPVFLVALFIAISNVAYAERYIVKKGMSGSTPECVDTATIPELSMDALEARLSRCYRKQLSPSLVQLSCENGNANFLFYKYLQECKDAISGFTFH